MPRSFFVKELLERFACDNKLAIALMRGERLEYAFVNTSYAAIREPGLQFIGRTYRDVFPEAAERGAEAKLQEVMRSGRPWYVDEFETPIPGREGMTWWEGECLPIAIDGVQVDSVLVINWEITERKRAQQAVREADQRKDAFLAMLAHELRTPLSAVKHSLELLGQKDVTEQQRDAALERMKRQADHMAHLLNDLLDVSRVAQGKLSMRLARIDLLHVLRRAIEMSRPVLEAKGHRLQIDLPPGPVSVNGDAVRLTQIFTNLLVNAAKYTNAGGLVRLSAEADETEAVVRVVDNGIGIEAAMLQHIFDPFSQLQRRLSDMHEGLGIGLALVKGLVDLHGGTVRGKSEGRAKGSEFTVRLPLVHSDAPGTEAAQPVSSERRA